MKWKNKGHEYDELGAKFKGKKIILYGTAIEASSFCSRLSRIDDGIIEAVVGDENVEIDTIYGAPIISKLEFTKYNSSDYIVILCCLDVNNYRAQAHRQIMNLGYKDGISCFNYEAFDYYYLPIFSLYACNKLYFKSICILLTTFCNLNCKCCLNFTSYNKDKKHFDINELKRTIDAFFSKVDIVYKFHISGGEPFLYPYFCEIVDYIGENYQSKIMSLRLVTNGTIMPSEKMIASLKKNSVEVEIDDYSRTLGSKSKAMEISALLSEKGIQNDLICVPSWINMDPLDKWMTDELYGKVNACNVPFTCIKDGRLYGCIYSCFAMEAGIVSKASVTNDSIDLESENEKSVFLETVQGYSERGYWEYCKGCPGHEWMGKHYVLPAQQI
ncbi:MAG: radical SAM protein [Acetatifactor sp.]|nr:radical SAM protein [Acetatifactor sp.]